MDKAAAANGFRLERGIDHGWMHFASTTARGSIWIGGASKDGPWLLSVERCEVSAEMDFAPTANPIGPGVATYSFDRLSGLYGSLDRAYGLSLSLPDAPLNAFRAAVQGIPRLTEIDRLTVQRVGQDLFRQALITYWNGRCPLTGISDPALLRASHIIPWAECLTDDQRLGVHNGLLLSALWDAAFDSGLISFSDDGTAVASDRISQEAAALLDLPHAPKLLRLTPEHKAALRWHREKYGIPDA